jgi:VWFA-related protein
MTRCRWPAAPALLTAALMVASALPLPAQDGTRFRAETDAVRVDVSVQQRGRPVLNLQASDFEIRDAGIAQRVTDVSYERIPLDVTIVFDVSQSVTGQTLDRLRQAVDQVRGRLRPGDRLKLLTFNMRVQRVLDFTDLRTDTAPVFSAIRPAGSTSLLDALAVAMVSPVPPARRHLVIVFSDGQDTSSVTDDSMLIDVARHTTATVACVLSGSSSMTAVTGADASQRGPASGQPFAAQTLVVRGPLLAPIFQRLAVETGGIVVPVLPGDVATSFTRVLNDLRSTYVLHFSPEGTPKQGFHELQVRVTRSDPYEIRARRGYFAD